MDDEQIIRLYFDRSEQAIAETDRKYRTYCRSIAFNILSSDEDADEAVNDTFLTAWNLIPPKHPPVFSAFLGKITRNLSIDCWRKQRAEKRGGGQITLALEELTDCVSGTENAETAVEQRDVLISINNFIGTLKESERNVFLCRYWYLDSIEVISGRSGFSTSKVKSMLFRIRKRLYAYLKEDGLV